MLLYLCSEKFEISPNLNYFLFTGDWYEIMNNKKFALAFSKNKPDIHDKYMDWLIHFMDFFATTTLHKSQKESVLKPTQKGVLMTTLSVLQLQHFLLDIVGFQYVLSARFSNDCVENFFR